MKNRLLTLTILIILLMVACGGEEPVTEEAVNQEPSPAEPTTAPQIEETDPEELLEEAAAEIEEAAAEIEELLADPITYIIDPDQSEVRFELDEVLRGNPITVVGVGNDLTGSITVDLNDPSSATISTMTINPAALLTDQDRRNGAINRFILQTGTYPEITFEPTALTGLPAAAAVGETVNFQIEGNLTIRDVTQPTVFEAAVTVVDENTLIGTAETVIQRGDFGLQIPSVPAVANVEEEVELYLDFVAVAE